MAVKGIAFTVYPVSDLDQAIPFYRDVVGIPLGLRHGNVYAEFTAPDGASFGLANLPAAMQAKFDFPMNVGEPGSGRALAFEVDDIDATIGELSAAGYETPPKTESPFCWMTTLHDPDGNRVIIHQLRPREADAA